MTDTAETHQDHQARIDGDLLAELIAEACPGVLSDDACRETAKRALLMLADTDGVTVVQGPDSTPWKPDSRAQHANTTVGNARLMAALAARDRALYELRKELEHHKNQIAGQGGLNNAASEAEPDRRSGRAEDDLGALRADLARARDTICRLAARLVSEDGAPR